MVPSLTTSLRNLIYLAWLLLYFIFTGRVCVFLIAGVFYSNLGLKIIFFLYFDRLIASK